LVLTNRIIRDKHTAYDIKPNAALKKSSHIGRKAMNLIKKIESEHLRLDMPEFRAGDTIKVYMRIIEGEKERIQMFQGAVIRVRRGGIGSTFMVRKISDGVGVERIFPTNSPFIDRIEVVTQGAVRRSRLYYLRKLKGKAARIKTKTNW
jgi:large subunit ribosomal protein L19